MVLVQVNEILIESFSLMFICSIALVGLVYPMIIPTIDQTSFVEDHHDIIRKSQVCKSLVMFIGINHLCAVS